MTDIAFNGTNGQTIDNGTDTGAANWAQMGAVNTTRSLAVIQSNEAGNNNFENRAGRFVETPTDICVIDFKAGGYSNNAKRACIRSTTLRQGYFITVSGLSGDNFGTLSLCSDDGTTETLGIASVTGITFDRTADQRVAIKAESDGGGGINIRASIDGGTTWETWNAPTSSQDYNIASPMTGGESGFYLTSNMAEADSRVDNFSTTLAGGGGGGTSAPPKKRNPLQGLIQR